LSALVQAAEEKSRKDQAYLLALARAEQKTQEMKASLFATPSATANGSVAPMETSHGAGVKPESERELGTQWAPVVTRAAYSGLMHACVVSLQAMWKRRMSRVLRCREHWSALDAWRCKAARFVFRHCYCWPARAWAAVA